MPNMTEPKELLVHELADLLYAERRFLTGTKALARETNDPSVKQRIEQHVEETEKQIARLEQAFASIGEKAKGEKCEAAVGLREEHDSFKSEEKPTKTLLEAFDLGSGLRVEHYEIAGYRSAIAVANALGHTECAEILKQSLAEEEDMANFLERAAPAALKKLFAAA
jgi:ferritin-like metal-binding protein YciE